MNKYVRTKDYIKKINNEAHMKDNKVCRFNIAPIGNFYDINESIIIWDNIIKQADTIEELCDEFIYANKIEGLIDKTHTISFEDMLNHQFTEPTTAEKLEYIYKRYKDDLDKIKLGIWTDKGLIYVAKMNDKGELELI